MKSKTMKVLYSSRPRTDRNAPYYSGLSYIETPKISMEGKWLEALGFHIGDPIRVEYDESGIRIRPLTAEERAAKEREEMKAEIRRKTAEMEKLQQNIASEAAALSRVAEAPIPYQVSSDNDSNKK